MRNTTPTVAHADAVVKAAETVDPTAHGRARERACQTTASGRPGSASLALERLLEEISNQDAEARADRLTERAYNLAQRLDDLAELIDMRGTHDCSKAS